MYENKEYYELEIPNVKKKSFVRRTENLLDSYKFSKEMFNKLSFVCQWDNKFLITYGQDEFLILFDQHAVHERIRLEKILKGMYNKC